MTHVEIRIELASRIERLLTNDDLPLTLHPHQRETFEHMLIWLRDPDGSKRGYIEHPTGLGKTLLFGMVAAFSAGMRTLIVVPTKVLVEQTARAIIPFTGGLVGHLSSLNDIRDEEGTVIAIRGHEYVDIVIATDESFTRYASKIARDFAPHLVVWDECHWAYRTMAEKTLPFFPDAVVIGFTATADYLTTVAPSNAQPITLGNGEVLYCQPKRRGQYVFTTCIDRRDTRWAIESGWLAPLAVGTFDIELSLDELPVSEGEAGFDFQPDALSAFLERNWSGTAQALRTLYTENRYNITDHHVFGVCPSIKTAEELTDATRDLGIAAACVTSKTPTNARNQIFKSFREGTIRQIFSVMVLREGWDEPSADVCLMFRPTRAYLFYVQTMGRVLRPRPGKVALVLDGTYTKTRFSPLSALSLYGKPGQHYTLGDILVGPKVSSPYLPTPDQRETVVIEPIVFERWVGIFDLFEQGGEQWGTDKAVANAIDMTRLRIRTWAERGLVRTFTGRLKAGVPTMFYSLADAQREAQRLWGTLRH